MKQEDIVFEEYSKNLESSSIVYILNGIMLEPKEMLENHTISSSANIYLVHYQRADTLEELFEKFLLHISTVSDGKSSIILVGFSTGGLVVHRLVTFFETLEPSLKELIVTISISPSHLKNYELLKKFTIEYLENLSQDVGYKILRRMPWYNRNSSMSFKEVVKQLKLFLVDEIYDKQLGVVDCILIPDKDKLCFEYDTALRFSKDILKVEGKHDISTIPMSSVINSYIR